MPIATAWRPASVIAAMVAVPTAAVPRTPTSSPPPRSQRRPYRPPAAPKKQLAVKTKPSAAKRRPISSIAPAVPVLPVRRPVAVRPSAAKVTAASKRVDARLAVAKPVAAETDALTSFQNTSAARSHWRRGRTFCFALWFGVPRQRAYRESGERIVTTRSAPIQSRRRRIRHRPTRRANGCEARRLRGIRARGRRRAGGV